MNRAVVGWESRGHQAGTSRFDDSVALIEPFRIPMSSNGNETRTRLFWSQIGTPTPPDLDGGPRAGVHAASQVKDSLELLFAKLGVADREASLLLATALLFNDQHDEAHDIVQDLSCREGCLLHAILHRREPDYWNAKYWFRRTTDHPIYRTITPRVTSLGRTPAELALLRRLTLAGTLDPIAMVDECEALVRVPEGEEARYLREIQRAEFEALSSHLLA